MAILFKDFSEDVIEKINALGVAWLEEASGEVESQTKRNTKVKTGRTKNSWEHRVDEDKLEAEVGSRYKNALWEEFGTGIYALNGDGRKTPWVYMNPNVKLTKSGKVRKNSKYGKFVYTVGKKPRRAFYKAYTGLKNKIIKSCQERFKRL